MTYEEARAKAKEVMLAARTQHDSNWLWTRYDETLAEISWYETRGLALPEEWV